MSNACGLVTSWTRWSPTNSCVWPVGRRRTVWRSQTFFSSVSLMGGRIIQRAGRGLKAQGSAVCSRISASSTTCPLMRCSWMIRSSTGGSQFGVPGPFGIDDGHGTRFADCAGSWPWCAARCRRGPTARVPSGASSGSPSLVGACAVATLRAWTDRSRGRCGGGRGDADLLRRPPGPCGRDGSHDRIVLPGWREAWLERGEPPSHKTGGGRSHRPFCLTLSGQPAARTTSDRRR